MRPAPPSRRIRGARCTVHQLATRTLRPTASKPGGRLAEAAGHALPPCPLLPVASAGRPTAPPLPHVRPLPQHRGGAAGKHTWGRFLRGRRLPPARQHSQNAGGLLTVLLLIQSAACDEMLCSGPPLNNACPAHACRPACRCVMRTAGPGCSIWPALYSGTWRPASRRCCPALLSNLPTASCCAQGGGPAAARARPAAAAGGMMRAAAQQSLEKQAAKVQAAAVAAWLL